MKMSKFLMGAGVTAGLLTMASAASAATFDYADVVVSEPAPRLIGTAGGFNVDSPAQNDPARADSSNALGAPDGDFFSLGNGGVLVLEFVPTVFPEGDATVIEITFGRNVGHDEAALVEFAGTDGVWSAPTQIDNLTAGSTVAITSSVPVKYVRITDNTLAKFPGTTSFDGFDVDAVGILVPSPAAVTGGLGLLALLGASKLRRRSA